MSKWSIYRIKTKYLIDKPISVIDTLAEAFDCPSTAIEYVTEEYDKSPAKFNRKDTDFDLWKRNLSDKQLLKIFFDWFDVSSIDEYLQQEYAEQCGKRRKKCD